MRNLLLLPAALLVSVGALAAGGGHGEDLHHIPWDMIQKQAFNFLLVVGGLTILLKSKVSSYFAQRAQSFESLVVLAKKAREDAEKQKAEISVRLQKLETTATESVERAKREAEELRAKIQAEAESLAKQIRDEAKKTVEREIEKAQAELKDELLSQAMASAKETMKTSVQENDQKRLQNEFVEKIQVLR